MNDKLSKPYLSPSQLDLAGKCLEAYRRRYIEGERIPPGIAAIRGSGVHGGAEANFRQKIESHKDLPASDIVDAAVATFERRYEDGGVTLTPEEDARGATVVLSEAVDSTAALAEVHAEMQAPDYQPARVEETVRLTIPTASHDLLGVLDVYTDDRTIVDFKTGGKSKSQNDADTSVQLTAYAAFATVLDGKPPAGIKMDVLTALKTKTKRDVIETTRGPGDFAALAARTNAVLKVIQTGAFAPTSPMSWNCSARWCGYWSTCPYVNGGVDER